MRVFDKISIDKGTYDWYSSTSWSRPKSFSESWSVTNNREWDVQPIESPPSSELWAFGDTYSDDWSWLITHSDMWEEHRSWSDSWVKDDWR